MFLLFLKSIHIFLSIYFEAFSLRAIKTNPLSLNRLIFLLVLFPLLLCLQIIHFFGFFIDDILFRKYRAHPCNHLLFIIGIPRSGTTYIHRSLAQSKETTTLSTWEAVLAPSIFEKKCLCALASLDNYIGQPFKKTINRLIQFLSGDFQNVHSVSIDAAEEDYLTLLPIGACAILIFAFPHSPALKSLLNFETMNAREKTIILKFYHKNIQRHLYHQGADLLFLSKNAAFCTWLPDLKAHFPSAKFILSVRKPETAIPSQLKALNLARKLFGTDPKGGLTQSIILDAFKKNYRALVNFLGDTPEVNRQLIHQEALRLDSESILQQALKALALNISLAADKTKNNECMQSSPHVKITQLDKDPIDPSLQKSYEELKMIAPLVPMHSQLGSEMKAKQQYNYRETRP